MSLAEHTPDGTTGPVTLRPPQPALGLHLCPCRKEMIPLTQVYCDDCPAVEESASIHPSRKYLPTFADLVDRLAIVQLKAVFITERSAEYARERTDIEHDLDLILATSKHRIGAAEIHAIIVLMLANRFIWENESRARSGEAGQDKLLKLTHSINGVRNTAKNALAHVDGGRMDYKIDCFAAELVEEFGNWNVFK